MERRKLGCTDLEVSLLTLGTMTYGEQNSQAEAFEQMDYAVAHGINAIDVAEMYPVPPHQSTFGASESIVGHWLAKRGNRDQLVIATKVTGNGSHNPGFEHIRGGPRLSRAQIRAAVEDSLRRLQTDYIDVYQLHWPDRTTNFFGRLGYQHVEESSIPLEESLGALAELIKEGKIRHYGLSNETPWGVMESFRVAAHLNMPKPVSIQNPYNLLNRTYEIGLAEISIRESVGLLAYSPLAFGMLSGKYYGGARPVGSRLALYERFKRYANTNSVLASDAYTDVAQKYQVEPAELALAFVNHQQFVTTNIIGATTMEQLAANINSVSYSLSNELLADIEVIHQQYPNPAP